MAESYFMQQLKDEEYKRYSPKVVVQIVSAPKLRWVNKKLVVSKEQYQGLKISSVDGKGIFSYDPIYLIDMVKKACPKGARAVDERRKQRQENLEDNVADEMIKADKASRGDSVDEDEFP